MPEVVARSSAVVKEVDSMWEHEVVEAVSRVVGTKVGSEDRPSRLLVHRRNPSIAGKSFLVVLPSTTWFGTSG